MLTSFIIVVLHYIADFIFQAETWAVNKSKDFGSLTKHTATYSALWFVFSASMFSLYEGIGLYLSVIGALGFCLITFILHTITDYFTSKVTSRMFAAGKIGSPIPNFGAFSVIGFDQVLHYLQLFSTYWIILNWISL